MHTLYKMKLETKKWIGGFVASSLIFGGYIFIEKIDSSPKINIEDVQISHEQEVWIYSLEWCESNGKVTAINPKDNDGTPSYYSFQFKPDTMIEFGIKYEMWDKKIDRDYFLKNILPRYDLQKQIVKNMVLDKTVNFRQQFPACIKKLGLPPQ